MKLFAVVVLYNMLPGKSPTLRSLIEAAAQQSQSGLELSILIWDNTPGGQHPGDLPVEATYHAAPGNPGLSQAYNIALAAARKVGAEWFLTLDQDTILPSSFLEHLSKTIKLVDRRSEVAAIVPRVIGDGRELSPFYFALHAVPRWFGGTLTGCSEHAVYAVNSAATVRIQALCEVNGYNTLFPLDISDLDLFDRLNRKGYKVFVAGDLVVSHEFSLLNKQKRMSFSRYDAQLLDECAFWDLSMGSLARVERIVRLMGRVCKDWSDIEARPFRDRTIAEIKRRLVTSRQQRVAKWMTFATLRAANNGTGRLQC